MSKPLMAAFAAAFLLAAMPAASQPPAAATPQVEESLAFVARLGEAVNVQVAGMKKLLDAKPLFESMTTPARVKAAAPKVRALMAEARRSVQQSDAMLAAIVPPPGLRLGSLSPASMIAEVRSQNAKSVALLGDYDAFLVAAERGDRAAVLKAAPRLMEGSFLLVDGNATIYRNRQAAIPSDQSVHQALGIGVQLYRAESAAGRAWLAAKFGGRPDAAASSLGSQLAEVAREARALSAEGRTNLARELSELDRNTAGLGFQGEEAATLARIRQALADKAKLFAIGDELAGLAEAGARVGGAALAAQPSPQLLGQLAALELRFHGTLAEQAAMAAGKAP
ncbi:MAG TPA: hypothetical protein VFZ91_16160 [Allosphingosinicella sp.]